MKRAATVIGCVLAGLLVGAIWTLLQSDRYRADARVLVRPTSARIVPAVEALAESSLVESNVAQTLHLSARPAIAAKTGKGGVLSISADAATRERARQVDAEAVVVLMQQVGHRFGSAGVSAALLDPAHVAKQTSPTIRRNLVIAGLVGLVAGIALAVAVGGPRPRAALSAGGDPGVERRLQVRIDRVAAREHALARRAGELAALERVLARREHEVEERETPPDDANSAPTAALASTNGEEHASEGHKGLAGRWTLSELEAITRERSASASVAQREEWSTYLFFLREHADADGVLPSSFDQLVNDIFGPLPHGA